MKNKNIAIMLIAFALVMSNFICVYMEWFHITTNDAFERSWFQAFTAFLILAAINIIDRLEKSKII